MESLYFQQTELADSIRKILTNFKKDSKERKTVDYYNNKLELLDSHWREYQHNNEKLLPYESRGHKYFVESEFESMKEFYQSAKALISNCYEDLLNKGEPSGTLGSSGSGEQKGTTSAAPPAPARARLETARGTYSKLDDLLRKQFINFKAFARAVHSINVEFLRDKWEFEDALRVLQTRWTVVDNCHWEIMLELEEDEAYEYNYNKHEITYNNMRKEISSRMWSTSYREGSTPKMDVPVFTGNFHQWTSFKDLFNEAIHNNPSISSAQKMQFLKSKVKGEAERLIQHLPISSDNYSTCWEILNNRFNNKRQIFNTHISSFYNIPSIQQQSFVAIKRLHDVTLESLHAIKNLGVDISTWDPLLVYILSQKLDGESFTEYIESLPNPRELSTLKDFLGFLEKKFTTLESSQRRPGTSPKPPQHQQQRPFNYPIRKYNNKPTIEWKFTKKNEVAKSMHVATNKIKCPHCYLEHNLINCSKFIELNDDRKIKLLKQLNYCVNCIHDHNGVNCFSAKRCHKCNDRHHTTLHDYFATQVPKQKSEYTNKQREPSNNSTGSHTSQRDESSEILLATALIKVTAADNTQHTMRALIDQGSQVSIINERAAQQLGLKRKQCNGVIFGVGERENNCKGRVTITCQSNCSDFKFTTDVFIMNNLIKNLPNKSFDKPSWKHLDHILLADPEYNISRPVDILLGAEVYSYIMLEGLIRGESQSEPIAQHTELGWLLCGSVKTSFQCNVILNNIEDIHQFWKIEDISEQNEMSLEDQECLSYYNSTTKRLDSGRYEVSLPMKPELKEKLGASKEIAIAQFKNLERKFMKQESLATQYKQFITEYEQLKHMNQALGKTTQLECYLPHHAVQRLESSTTKLRVVFNASAKTSSGYSLNDLMYKGPNLQQDLLELILKWRQYRYAYTADIEKCFRMILVHENDQYLQQIVWREHPNQPLKTYKLSTITYGTKSAPFLTMMTLRRLASDEKHNFPKAAKSIQEELYMDDWISGSHSIADGISSIAEMNACLKSGGFSLRKWSSNDKQLLVDVEQATTKEPTLFTFKTETSSKTLGLRWNSVEDSFTFQSTLSSSDTEKLTKRRLLSEISTIFDPLGWLSPLITTMKLLFQQVWLNAEVQWSDEVSTNIKEQWHQLKKDIDLINQFKIPRWIQSSKGDVIELHGFCDASIKAFACVVYARIVKHDAISVVLIAAKTRLVPSKKAVSLPRLELCAAELLSKLMTKIINSFNSFNIKKYGWSDSKVTLGWIQGAPERWKPFVANRVRKTTAVMPPETWHYVNTKENPADAASRGLTSSQLIEHELWWKGPAFLSTSDLKQNESSVKYTTTEEAKKQVNIVQNIPPKQSIIDELLNKYSSITKIIHILCWIRRALTPNVSKQNHMYLTLHEVRAAKNIIIKHIQRSEFNQDIEHLLNKNRLKSDSKLSNLNPYLDENGILRAKGRLRNASISDEMKYPIIIPYSSRLTELLITQAHELTFHGGARLTTSFLRQAYWIIKGNRAVKKQVNKCVTCRKQQPIKLQQLMGDLPDYRTNPAPAFYHTGVDFTGLITVKANKGRGIKTTKGYVALFICMVTKAVHIELVSDLSSVAFIAALRRMAARRGTPKHMYSDNGTNFVGANKILQEEYEQLERVFCDSFRTEVAEMNIEWHWNCPSWPSAVGIWERSIRSLKQHLKRVVGEQALTFEEYSTVLSQIEATLNSRPLCPLSEDIDDLDYLTPGHFLTSRAGLTVIETAADARTRWNLMNKIFQDLWKRWKTEYLSQLSVRSKWLNEKSNIKVGDMVTIHEDNFPAGRFPMGRVVEVHPGKDGLARVVTLKTKNGFIKRPVIKLSILPINQTSNTKVETKQSLTCMKGRVKEKACPKFINIALSLLLFMTMLWSGEAHDIKITQFSSNQSLFYDRVGNVNIIRDRWTIVSYYNMQPYWQGDKAVRTFTQYLEKTCNNIKESSQCNIILTQLLHDYSELQHYNQLLLNQHFGTQLRTRRGLINAVGSVANSLFGVLDQNFADQYQRDIELVNSNQKHLLQLWKNQTSVVEAEYNILKRTETAISTQHKLINKHLHYIDQTTNKIQKEQDRMSMIQEFTMTALASSNLIQNLKRIQDTLVDTMTDIYHGKINLHLLTPSQLNHELQIVSSQISKELTLPISLHSNLYSIYELLKVKARMNTEYFIFEISVPLISRDNFQLYRLVPVPLQVGGKMISIIPISEYIATNLIRDSYLTASRNDFEGCQRQGETYLCQLQGPIKHLDPEERFCRVENLNRCLLKKETCQNMWLQLHDPSSYLYFTCDTYSLTIICSEETRVRRLSKAGLIQLDKECTAKGRDVTLFSYQQQNTLTLKPDIALVNIAPIQHYSIVDITPPPVEFIEDKGDLNVSLLHLGDQISSMKEAAQQDMTLTHHDVHHYVLSYMLLAAVVGVAAVLGFLWRRASRPGAVPQAVVAYTRDPAPAPSGQAPSTSSASESVNSVSARNQPVLEHTCETKRWSSLRVKKDSSTSPVIKKQSFFSIDKQ